VLYQQAYEPVRRNRFDHRVVVIDHENSIGRPLCSMLTEQARESREINLMRLLRAKIGSERLSSAGNNFVDHPGEIGRKSCDVSR
jgi:hypothetical protein